MADNKAAIAAIEALRGDKAFAGSGRQATLDIILAKLGAAPAAKSDEAEVTKPTKPAGKPDEATARRTHRPASDGD